MRPGLEEDLTGVVVPPKVGLMAERIFPRSPTETMCGWMHLPRFIDKIRLDLAGQLHPDYRKNLPKGRLPGAERDRKASEEVATLKAFRPKDQNASLSGSSFSRLRQCRSAAENAPQEAQSRYQNPWQIDALPSYM